MLTLRTKPQAAPDVVWQRDVAMRAGNLAFATDGAAAARIGRLKAKGEAMTPAERAELAEMMLPRALALKANAARAGGPRAGMEIEDIVAQLLDT